MKNRANANMLILLPISAWRCEPQAKSENKEWPSSPKAHARRAHKNMRLTRRRGHCHGVAEGDGEAGLFLDSLFFSLIGPIFTIFASNVPSAFFQYEPLTSSFSAISFIVAVAAPFVIMVLSVILKTRDFCLPAIVKVFVF